MHYGAVDPLALDVTGAKEIVLRVYNDGGNGNSWGFESWVGLTRDSFRPVRRPWKDPRRSSTPPPTPNAALFLAEVHWRLDHKDVARRWYKRAAEWMEKNKTEAEKLRQYYIEAGKLLGIAEKSSPAKQQPEKAKQQDQGPKG